MSDFEKASEHLEKKQSQQETAMSKFWDDIKKKAETSRMPTPEEAAQKWWDTHIFKKAENLPVEQPIAQTDDSGLDIEESGEKDVSAEADKFLVSDDVEYKEAAPEKDDNKEAPSSDEGNEGKGDTELTEDEETEPDDEGEIYSNDGKLLPNKTYKIDGKVIKTDDNGEVYSADGKLIPNHTYVLNGSTYKTDDKGRIISCKAQPKNSPENTRDNNAQQTAGGENRRPNDNGGHIVGRDMNGDGGEGNIIAMDSRINQSDYKRMENAIKKALEEGKEVITNTEIVYDGDSQRPSNFIVTVIIDGKETVYTYDNNKDGSLMEKVSENGSESDVETVQSVLDDTGGQITSVVEEYDSDGNLVKTTVNITYVDENGNNQRRTVVIDNSNGGNK